MHQFHSLPLVQLMPYRNQVDHITKYHGIFITQSVKEGRMMNRKFSHLTKLCHLSSTSAYIIVSFIILSNIIQTFLILFLYKFTFVMYNIIQWQITIRNQISLIHFKFNRMYSTLSCKGRTWIRFPHDRFPRLVMITTSLNHTFRPP